MIKLLAFVTLFGFAFFIQLGNYWFTYGLWPRNWISFAIFYALTLINYILLDFVKKEMKD